MKTMLLVMLTTAALPSAVSATSGRRELVANGSFEATSVAGKARFLDNVSGWSGGARLTFIDTPGTADDRSYLSVYGPFPNHSPDGGRFVEADGDPSYSGAISQSITGLTAGATYRLHFLQAAGQQLGFTGPTTERWSVSFGSDTKLSRQFSLPQGSVGPWQRQAMTFTAHSAAQVLTFLAAGTPRGAPPIAFLDGVSMTSGAPEPASWALLVAGFALVGAGLRRRTLEIA